MKKTLLIVALVLAITTSIIAGTMAYYTTTLPDLVKGEVVAKEFILLKGGTNTFSEGVKIAPGETVKWDFSVKNFDGNAVSETGMDLDVTVLVEGGEKKYIYPLTVTVTEKDGAAVLGTMKPGHTGDIKFNDTFKLAEEGQEKVYSVNIEWPWQSAGVNDITYAGSGHGATIKVSVTGTQIPTTTESD
jgi:hypothetical protein